MHAYQLCCRCGKAIEPDHQSTSQVVGGVEYAWHRNCADPKCDGPRPVVWGTKFDAALALVIVLILVSFPAVAQKDKTFPMHQAIEAQALFCLSKESAIKVALAEESGKPAADDGQCFVGRGIVTYHALEYTSPKGTWRVYRATGGGMTFYEATSWLGKEVSI